MHITAKSSSCLDQQVPCDDCYLSLDDGISLKELLLYTFMGQ